MRNKTNFIQNVPITREIQSRSADGPWFRRILHTSGPGPQWYPKVRVSRLGQPGHGV